MQTTDVVCSLHGDELAHILRPCWYHFQFFGECYVAELSSGKRWKAQQMKKKKVFKSYLTRFVTMGQSFLLVNL